MKKFIMILSIGATLCLANGPQGGQGRGEMKEPPAEAISACKDKTEGDTCDITTPQGEAITGTCKNTPDDKYFVCMPENMERQRPNGNR